MILLSELKAVLSLQREKIINQESLERDLLKQLKVEENFALIISGIRRCGKSTLLSQLINQQKDDWLYLNFDTPRLFNFEFTDFRLLDELIRQDKGIKVLFFDEIQVVEQWEIYIRGKLDEGYLVVVTGSNASLLSRELGTKLTGRHISKELYPFSFLEFCVFKSLTPGEQSLTKYLEAGGMPQFLKSENPDILHALVNDILYRDIAVRHNIRDEKPLQHLLMFLVSNVGNLISANKIRQTIGVKSATTVQEYLSFMQSSYLIHLMPKFSYSYRAQMVNPKKVYFIDNGLQAAISPSLMPDWGRRFENMLFWEIQREGYELFYYNENDRECDFVVVRNNTPIKVIQACFELNSDNIKREVEGVKDAMNFFGFKEGYIVTKNQSDIILVDNLTITVIPVYDFVEKFKGH